MQNPIDSFLIYEPWYIHGVTKTNSKLETWLNNNSLYQKIYPALEVDIIGMFFDLYKLKFKKDHINDLFIRNGGDYMEIKKMSLDIFKNRNDINYCGLSPFVSRVLPMDFERNREPLMPALRINTITKWNQKILNSFDLISYKYRKDDKNLWVCDITVPPRWNTYGISKFYEELIDSDILKLLTIKLQEELIEKV